MDNHLLKRKSTILGKMSAPQQLVVSFQSDPVQHSGTSMNKSKPPRHSVSAEVLPAPQQISAANMYIHEKAYEHLDCVGGHSSRPDDGVTMYVHDGKVYKPWMGLAEKELKEGRVKSRGRIEYDFYESVANFNCTLFRLI